VAKVTVVTPVRENLVSSISSNGKVEPISPFVMRAQLDTFVSEVHATEGEKVRKGQLLLELDVKDAAAQLAQAKEKLVQAEHDLRIAKSGGSAGDAAKVKADLSNATATRDKLQQDQTALEKLLKEHAATMDEVAANQLSLTKAQAEVDRLQAVKAEFDRNVGVDAERMALQVQQSQNQVASLEEKVRDGRITSPADGTLYSMPVKRGDFVKVGDLLGEMADLHKVRVRAFIDEPDLGVLETNEPVRITWDALPNRSWQGLTEVIPKQVVQRGMRSVGELLCSVNNDKLELLPNINVNVRINSRERTNVLTIPRGTVESEGTKRFVFVVMGDDLGVGKHTLEKREIRVGIADSTSYEVVSGLGESEVVAVPGDLDLKDGMPVQVVNTRASNIQGAVDDD
jgi:HlyD family secretion protein